MPRIRLYKRDVARGEELSEFVLDFGFLDKVVAKRGGDIRVAVTGAASDGVFRVKSFEEALKKRFSPKSLEGLTIPADGMNSDIHGSAEYRAHLVAVLARRAVADAIGKPVA